MTFRDSNVYDVEVKIGKLVLVLRKVHIIEYVLLYDDALDTETTYDEHFYSIVYNSDEGEVNEEIDEAMYYRYLNYKWVSSLVDKLIYIMSCNTVQIYHFINNLYLRRLSSFLIYKNL
jgi:hypothetical protein